MAEAMTEMTVVPVPAGTLTEADYEALIDAMLPSGGTEVAPPVEIAVEPEKPAIVAETALAQSPKAKPPRVCKICGHADGNSVGRIKLGRIIQIEKGGLKVFGIEPICTPCVEHLPPEERKKIGKIGYLISVVGLENGKIYAARDARAYWAAWKASEVEPLEVRRDRYGMLLCGVPRCRLCSNDELAVRFTIVKNAEGERQVAGVCRDELAVLTEVGVQNIRLFSYQSAVAELDRRNRENASKTAPPPKQPEPPEVTEIAVEPEKSAVATEVKSQLTRAEREARRWDRRRKLALAVGNTRFGAGKRHKGGQKGGNGGGKKR